MDSGTRRLAFLLTLSTTILLTTLYSLIPLTNPKIARLKMDNRSMEIPRAATEVPPVDPICLDGVKSNLCFLKTHKTGSSTLQNILVRYAWDKKLLVGLPSADILFRSYYHGKKFKKSEMQNLPNRKKPNMLVHHMVFNHQEVESALPTDAVYFTILRDPATHFESVFKYMSDNVRAFKLTSKLGGLEEFVTHPTKYFTGNESESFWWFAKNGQFFDLGYDNLNETDTYISDAVNEINKIFDFVLISEYFDTSLILLKDLLCWNMTNMAYLSMNRRNPSTVQHVTDDVKKKIYDWNKADNALYQFFNGTFWKRVEKYGKERMESSLNELKSIKKKLTNFCVQDHLISNKDIKDPAFKMFSPKGIDVNQYKLKEEARNNETCRGLILPEVEWWKKLSMRQKQRKRKILIKRH